MPRIAQKYSRRQQILESLAHMLEVSPGERITTAVWQWCIRGCFISSLSQ